MSSDAPTPPPTAPDLDAIRAALEDGERHGHGPNRYCPHCPDYEQLETWLSALLSALTAEQQASEVLARQVVELMQRTGLAEADLTAEQQAHERTRAELELAIAHDRQPYPTAAAYEAACAAVDHNRAKLAATEATLEARNREVGELRAQINRGVAAGRCLVCAEKWPACTCPTSPRAPE